MIQLFYNEYLPGQIKVSRPIDSSDQIWKEFGNLTCKLEYRPENTLHILARKLI